MKNRCLVVVLFLLSSVLVGSAVAQQHEHGTAQKPAEQAAQAAKPMECPHQQNMMAAMQKLEQSVNEGQQSSDPAKMKASLTTAQAHLKEMKQHMSMCPMMSGQHGTKEHKMMQHGTKEHMHGSKPKQPEQPNQPE